MKKPWVTVLIILGVIFAIIYMSSFFYVVSRLFIGGTNTFGNVAVIDVHGIISETSADEFGYTIASAQDIVSFIEEADNNPLVKAIVLDINSPGGSAVASDEIAKAVKAASKPTYALIHEIGTSGAYWIASSADMVVANRMSITGSIGVIASYLEFSGLMEDYGVDYQRFVSGKYKDLGSPFKPPTADERELLQSKINKLHDFFVKEVAENRNLNPANVRALATGEIFLGEEAMNLGLIDALGNKDTVEENIRQSLNITDISYIYYFKETSLFERLIGLTNERFFLIGKGIGNSLANPQLSSSLKIQ